MLRPYQRRAADRARQLAAAGKRVLVCAPTGAGKTTIAVEGLIQPYTLRGRRCLFVAHTREIIDQAAARAHAMGMRAGVIMGSRAQDHAAPLQVASLQTLDARREYPRADVVFIDEAHRAASAMYRRLVEAYPEATLVGLTATPWRLDGRGLSPPHGPFDELVIAATPAELVSAGHLVPDVVYGASPPDLEKLKVDAKTRDYAQGAMSTAFAHPTYVGDAVANWKRHAEGLRTLTFAVSREHGQAIAQAFREAGVRAAYVDGQTKASERAAALEKLRTGEVTVLVNVDVFVEGFDEPLVGCVQVVRATLSLSRWIQMVGRGKRPITDRERDWCRAHGVAVPSKSRVIVLDHGANVQRHGFPQADRVWTLEGTEHQGSRASEVRDAPERARLCRKCGRAIETGATRCPGCGFEAPTMPGFVDAMLIPLRDALRDLSA